MTLPVIGERSAFTNYRTADGEDVSEESVHLEASSVSIRRCDNCVLASQGCPGFQAGHLCQYNIPVTIKSKDQLQSALTAVIEIQTQRVLMSRFAEEVAGQELDASVGREMDRLFNLVDKLRNITDNRDTVKMTLEAKSNSGVLSRLFGPQVGEKAKMLQAPIDSNDFIEESFDN